MRFRVAAAAIALAATAVAARAEPYVDYTPAKGVWDITQVHVAPGKIDDYLSGLKKSWVPSQEIDKRHGIIDGYWVLMKLDPAGTGANVLLGRHIVSLAAMEPDKARDKAIEQENEKVLPKDNATAMVKGYNEYRTFVAEGLFQAVEFPK